MHWWKSPEKTQKESGVYLHAICKYHNMYSGNRRAIKEGVLFGLSCLKLAWQKFDVIDVDHMPFFPIFSAWIVCLLRGRKLHATWHEALTRQEWTAYMGPRGIIAAFIERLSIKLPHRITAASEHTRQLLATVHGRVERVDLVPSGIDTSLLDTVQPASIHCDVLYVGRLVKDKNVDKLIAAVEIIAQTRPDVQCMIVGQGTEKQRLQKMVIKLRMQNNVTFAKPLAKAAEVYAYMKAARVFCLPSVREGFGIVALEALGCGTPVITIESPTNAARSLIQDGVNGSVVPLNPAALADSIRYWASMDQKPNIAFNAANYDWHNLAQKQAEVYSL
jgi:glycosyltransferase involved in cell wall biosynthesis